MENAICGTYPFQLPQERLDEHRGFGDSDSIQEFWYGSSKDEYDELAELQPDRPLDRSDLGTPTISDIHDTHDRFEVFEICSRWST